MLDLLVVAAHPDDAEIGAGGLIARYSARGRRVGILDLTDGEPTPFGSPPRRRQEAAEATRILGACWRHCLGLPNRSLEPTLEARRAVAAVLRQQRPAVLLAPFWQDVHPDHVAASELAQAARFWAKLTKCDLPGQPHWPAHIFYYYSLHLRAPERPSFVIDISDQIERKLQAVGSYQSQFGRRVPGPRRDVPDELLARARYWGWTIGTSYGEPFYSREPVALLDLPTQTGGQDRLVDDGEPP